MTPSVLVRRSRTDASLVELIGDGETHTLPLEGLPEAVCERERAQPRWVWDSTAHWYPGLVAAGVRVSRCLDLRLSRAILRGSLSAPRIVAESVASPDVAGESLGEEGAAALRRHEAAWEDWDGGWGARVLDSAEPGLFEMDRPEESSPEAGRDVQAQWLAQERALGEIDARNPARARALRLLIAAESAGALAAVELHHDGLPLREDLHVAHLEDVLGERGRPGERPRKLEELAGRIRSALGEEGLNPDSTPHLLRALRREGLDVSSTSQWELQRLQHPVIADLLAYKKLARLASANGWAWVESWVSEGRFRADYVPAGVVTGRWSSRGGGALSLPKAIRSAVVADPGWTFVVADAAQLEPRILAAISGDEAMLAAAARGDLYQALVEDGVVEDRDHAKVAMLGALYGSSTGLAGALVPRLARAFPRALALVDDAAATGEAGGVVTTWLGRTSPPPSAAWSATQRQAWGAEGTTAQQAEARRLARDWGRFTRNFVVQGSAAEWALAWMAYTRAALAGHRARLAFFMHDELVVHAPQEEASSVREVMGEAARAASAVLFPGRADLVPLDVVVAECYADLEEENNSSTSVIDSSLAEGAAGSSTNPASS